MSLALVTGAASGIGRATTRKLADAGHALLLCDRDAAGLAVVAGETGGTALPLDLLDLGAVRAVADTVTRQHGRLDALVCCAGISGHGMPFAQVDEAAWDAMLGTHAKGHFFLIQALLSALAPGAAIVIVSSLFALRGSPNMPHYTVAKGALIGMARALAVELGPAGIRVNAVAPGLIRTPMTEHSATGDADFFTRREATIPLRRLTTPEDVADSIAYLASPAAGSLTGQVLSPSGGEAFTG
jgi:NAD(P)-dependent dehydrogenase (short-subunit alcohol dehydrogenase family)